MPFSIASGNKSQRRAPDTRKVELGFINVGPFTTVCLTVLILLGCSTTGSPQNTMTTHEPSDAPSELTVRHGRSVEPINSQIY